jgi:hypothetical protein
MNEVEIEALVCSFEEHRLAHADWNHAAHLTLATVYTRRYGLAAVDEIRTAIQSYNESIGVVMTDTSGYHETMTVFFMRMVAHVLKDLPEDTPMPEQVEIVIERLGDRKIMLEHYTRDLAMSRDARYGWIEPDLKPLPFSGRIPASVKLE